jgi:hypothetical protein
MLFRLAARLSDADPELPFREAPFPEALIPGDVVRFADVVRLADVERWADVEPLAVVVRRFWLAPPLRAVDRFVVFVVGSESEVVVFRRVAGLDLLVVAIGFPHPEALFHLPASATPGEPVSNRRPRGSDEGHHGRAGRRRQGEGRWRRRPSTRCGAPGSRRRCSETRARSSSATSCRRSPWRAGRDPDQLGPDERPAAGERTGQAVRKGGGPALAAGATLAGFAGSPTGVGRATSWGPSAASLEAQKRSPIEVVLQGLTSRGSHS